MSLSIDGFVALTPRQQAWMAMLDNEWRPPLIETDMRKSLEDFLVHWMGLQLQRDGVVIRLETLSTFIIRDALCDRVLNAMQCRRYGVGSCLLRTKQQPIPASSELIRVQVQATFGSKRMRVHVKPSRARACEEEAANQLQVHMIPDLADIVLDYLAAPHCPRASRKRKEPSSH